MDRTNPNPTEAPDPAQRPPVWVPLSRAADTVGMRVDLLRSSIEAGQIPLRLQAFGRRGVLMVNGPDLAAYVRLQSSRHPLELAR